MRAMPRQPEKQVRSPIFRRPGRLAGDRDPNGDGLKRLRDIMDAKNSRSAKNAIQPRRHGTRHSLPRLVHADHGANEALAGNTQKNRTPKGLETIQMAN